jgi:hypothetical protein
MQSLVSTLLFLYQISKRAICSSYYHRLYALSCLIFTFSFSLANATPIKLYKSFEGNIALATAGHSELNETGGTGNCGNGNQTTDSVTLPAGATVKAAYLYWYAMTKNNTWGDNYPFIEISNTAPVTFPSSLSTIITATRQFQVTKGAWGGAWKYSGRFADVTTQVQANPNGTYTVDVQGGASNSACAYSEENVRAWNLLIIYDAPSITDNKKIYIYDGIKGYLSEGISTSVSGFQVPSTATTGELTVVSIQGDEGIAGEYMKTSDTAFPDFPSDFADGDHGPALDIDTLSGDFTPSSTSINLDSGSNQDLIFTTNIILTIPTVPAPSAAEFCTYNLKLAYGETFNIRDYIQQKDGYPILDWSQVTLSYDQPTSPNNWHLSDFSSGQNVTVTANDALANTGNVGDGRYRITLRQTGQTTIDDVMTIRVSANQSNLNAAKCNSSPPPSNQATLTLLTTINNDNNGTVTVNDLGITTSAGTLTFDTGTTSGTNTTYTSNSLSINAGSYTLSANDDSNYTETLWSCTDANAQTLTITSGTAGNNITGSFTIHAGDNFTCTINYDDIAPTGCNALSNDINAGLTTPPQGLKNGNKLFLGSTTLATKTGHLKAFSVDATGLPSGSPLWDAATQMTNIERENRLYSTDASGNVTLLKNLSTTDFATTAATVTTLKNILFNTVLGTLSANSNLALIDNQSDTLNYLRDPYYRGHYTNVVSGRTQRILTSSDDGFLYAFNQTDGDLGWGWMPRSLVAELQNTGTFRDQHYMQGAIDFLDLRDTSTSYKSYIIGSYKQGLGHYVLRLNNDTSSDLNAVVWDEDLSASKVSAPNNGKRAYFKDVNEAVYAVYIATGNTTNSSTLYIKQVTNNNTPLIIQLPFTATSTPYIIGNNATTKTLYLGDNVGNIYAAPLLQTNGNLETTSNILNALTSTITSLDTNATDAVLYIGSVKSSSNNKYYLRAQSDSRLTVFSYNTTSSTWVRMWSSYVSGSNKWSNGTTSVTDNNITALPSDAHITDNAYIVADSIVLPITLDPSNNACYGLSYYYFFKLDNGYFPSNTFYTTNATPTVISSPIALGSGQARTLHLANVLDTDKLLGFGMADQDSNGNAGINASFTIIDSFTTGIRSWRELR